MLLGFVAIGWVEIEAQQRCMVALHKVAGSAKGFCVPPLSGSWPA